MEEENKESPFGRPERDFDQKTFEGLCHVWCTGDEIEHILRTDKRTLNKWCLRTYNTTFTEAYNRFASGGKASLRRNQLNLSKKNASMGIWLGKQKLGQKDLPQDQETFNGRLVELLEKLAKVETQEDFKDDKLSENLSE